MFDSCTSVKSRRTSYLKISNSLRARQDCDYEARFCLVVQDSTWIPQENRNLSSLLRTAACLVAMPRLPKFLTTSICLAANYQRGKMDHDESEESDEEEHEHSSESGESEENMDEVDFRIVQL